MKTLLALLVGLFAASFTLAESAAEIGSPKRTTEDLRKLLAPIALYPDALVALILPACTNSADLVLAARFLANQGDPKQLDEQPWDESVKSLARYPEVIKWMDENLEWTTELGAAFAAQPADVMKTVQDLRLEAQAAGLLTDTPQQKVVVREEEVSIQPAQEDVIYVPYYDPEVLIVHRPVYGPWISFGAGFAVGSWLNYDCDWRSRHVVVARRHPGWSYRPDWRWRDRHHAVHVHREWRPSDRYWRHVHSRPHREFRPVPVVVRPGYRHGDASGSHRGDDRRRWDGRRDDHRNDQRNWGARDGRRNDTQRVRPERPRESKPDLTAGGTPARIQDNRSNGDRRGRNSPAANQNQNSNAGTAVRGTDHRAPPASALATQPSVAVPTVSPASNSNAAVGNQNRRQSQERRFPRHVEAGGQRTYRHQNSNSPSVQPGASAPSAQPPTTQRFGGHGRRDNSGSPPARQSPPPQAAARVSTPSPAAAVSAPPPAAVQRGDGGGRQNNGRQGSREGDRGGDRGNLQRALR